MNDYQRIEKAIHFIRNNFKTRPNLEEVAAHVALSSFHFQRLFTEWAGVSPKKFLQYLSLDHAKSILKNDKQATLFDVSYQTGLSGTGRLHDLFIGIEGMTPGEYKNEGEQLNIAYSFSDTPFGNVIIASTAKGICYMAFIESEKKGYEDLRFNFPKAIYEKKETLQHRSALSFFVKHEEPAKLKLHLKGTDFQLKVWEALLKIPAGKLVSYGHISERIKAPKASRAVGSAIGSNPVAFLIPCHRVIQSGGNFGNYMWGPDRKAGIIGWEAASVETETA
jgi:AraC family transcriptional regulator, regulatory protein of adaptative response / methylated-DNA-[protein]-cysteine methyltransferase